MWSVSQVREVASPQGGLPLWWLNLWEWGWREVIIEVAHYLTLCLKHLQCWKMFERALLVQMSLNIVGGAELVHFRRVELYQGDLLSRWYLNIKHICLACQQNRVNRCYVQCSCTLGNAMIGPWMSLNSCIWILYEPCVRTLPVPLLFFTNMPRVMTEFS